jgi:hypothetical protein
VDRAKQRDRKRRRNALDAILKRNSGRWFGELPALQSASDVFHFVPRIVAF